MNLISCNICGVVLDKDKLVFPELHTKNGYVTRHALWDGEHWINTTKCPVCKSCIREDQQS